MNKLGIFAFLMILCTLVTFEFVSSSAEEDKKITKPSFTERLTSLLYVSSPSPTSNSASTDGNWGKLKALVNQARAYFSPPNLDFRGSEENEPISGAGAGEKVKEAAVKSLEKSKEAVEDSAKSAAKIASETVQKTKEKVKKSISGKREADHQQSEL